MAYTDKVVFVHWSSLLILAGRCTDTLKTAYAEINAVNAGCPIRLATLDLGLIISIRVAAEAVNGVWMSRAMIFLFDNTGIHGELWSSNYNNVDVRAEVLAISCVVQRNKG